MNKERIKSIFLVLLVLTNLVLADKILVNKKLWPSGYNFFANAGKNKKNTFSVAGNLAVPERIIVNTGYQSSRFEYKRSDATFDTINSAAAAVLKKAFSASVKSPQAIPQDEWFSVLTAKSIYLSYPIEYSSQIFSELIGENQTEFSLNGFSDIAISDSGNVYISDKSGYFKITVGSDSISPIIAQAASEHSEDDSIINYAFDLNFDKDSGDQRTLLSPMIPIYSAPVSAPIQTSVNPVLKSDGNISSRAIEGILTAFSINPDTVRRYTEADGSIVFVENNGILKISPDGILNFKANVTGIKLSGSTSGGCSELAALAAFIDNVNAAIDIQSDMLITSPLTELPLKTVSFDYIAGGYRVKYNNSYAVTAAVSGGYITEYTQILRRYSPQGHLMTSPMYIDALDSITSKYQDAMKDIRITKMFPSYIDDMTVGEKSLDWHIEIDNIIAQ